jgi:lysophospholipase L1-like esterase
VAKTASRILVSSALAWALVGCDGAASRSPEQAPTPAPPPAPTSADAVGGPPKDAADAPAAVAKAPADPPWQPREGDRVTPHQALEFPAALDPFIDALARVDDGKPEVVRVLHYGASMIGMDDLTSVLRGKFQTRFGDGGAGMVLLQRFMSNYIHRGVRFDGRGWQHCYIGYLCKKDGFYGLGGVTFWSTGKGKTTIGTLANAPGDTVSKFELWYAAEPRGGSLVVAVDGGESQRIDTAADTLTDRWETLDVEPGPHEIEIKTASNGKVRAYGVVLETDGPGITWEQFSWLGAFTKRMHGWNDAHIAAQVAHRDPDLVLFTFGGNDTRRVANEKLTQSAYTAEYLEGVRKVMAGKPGGSCLVLAMTDRGRSLGFEITPEDVEVIVRAQRETAREAGCAFFDTYTAMGGGGSMKAWRSKDPPLATGDLKHLTHDGRELFGTWVYEAIVAAYVERRTKPAAH